MLRRVHERGDLRRGGLLVLLQLSGTPSRDNEDRPLEDAGRAGQLMKSSVCFAMEYHFYGSANVMTYQYVVYSVSWVDFISMS